MAEQLTQGPYVVTTQGKKATDKFWPRLQRAVSGFLALPAGVVLLFVVLFALLFALERANPPWIQQLSAFLRAYIFADRETISGFLDTVASGLITMVSITISMLLLTLQQTASNMGNMIYDQFLHRYRNQVYIGFIIGNAVLAVLTLATVSSSFQPVLGATASMSFTILALVVFIWFLYTTIQQMRPETIVSAIHDRTLRARERQLSLIRRTQRQPRLAGLVEVAVRSQINGFVTEIELGEVADFLSQHVGQAEVMIHARLGDYVAYGDALVAVQAQTLDLAREVAQRFGDVYVFEGQRSLDLDPGFGLKQMEMIAWTEISTAKDNPETGLRVAYSLRDLLNRWLLEGHDVEQKEPLPVVYADNVLDEVLDVMESLVVVSSESMQHQTFAALIEAVALLFAHLPDHLQQRAEQLVRRALSVMGDHALSCEVETSMNNLIQVLAENGYAATAQDVRQATAKLAETVGQLNSRSTRAPQRNSGQKN